MSTDLVLHDSSTLSDQMEFARMVVAQPDKGAQSILPESYKGNPANVLIAVGLGASMGLSAAESLYRISIIKGKPTAGAELIATNVRKAGHRLRVRGDDTTCTATIVRADDPDYEFSVTRDMAWAKQMGLATNDNYRKQAGTMLQWRAITAVARLACPEALYGVTYEQDEMATSQPERKAAPRLGGMAGLREAVAPEPVEYVVEPAHDPAEPAHEQPVSDEIDPKGGQMKALHAGLNELGMGDRDAGLAFISDILDKPVTSSKDLSRIDCGKVLTALADLREQPFPAATE